MILAEVNTVHADFYCEECGHNWTEQVDVSGLAQENCFQVDVAFPCPNCGIDGDEEGEDEDDE